MTRELDITENKHIIYPRRCPNRQIEAYNQRKQRRYEKNPVQEQKDTPAGDRFFRRPLESYRTRLWGKTLESSLEMQTSEEAID